MPVTGPEIRSTFTPVKSILSGLLSQIFTTHEVSRPSVLVAWELGGGFGHTRRLLLICSHLAARGVRLVFAIRNDADVSAIQAAFPDASILTAPRLPRLTPDAPGRTYADLLLGCGYHSADTLRDGVAEWCRIFARESVAVVLCDHSPTVVLAAAGRVPVVHIGSGFATPPTGHPLLTLRPGADNGAKQREAQVLRAIQEVQHEIGTMPLTQISDLFRSAECFSCCLPELDPYGAVRPSPAIGPVHPLPKPEPLPDEPFLFGYLTGQDVRVPTLLASLVQAKVPAGIFIRHLDPVCEDVVQGSTVKLYYQPQNMIEALRSASAVLHHGGLSTAETALAMGRPQFVLPRHLEQSLTATTIERMGCGLNLSRKVGTPGETIRRAMERGTYNKQAAVTASHLAQRPQSDVAGMIVRAVLTHLGNTSTPEKPECAACRVS
jgi:rhamnosyltransferase subunit B